MTKKDEDEIIVYDDVKVDDSIIIKKVSKSEKNLEKLIEKLSRGEEL